MNMMTCSECGLVVTLSQQWVLGPDQVIPDLVHRSPTRHELVLVLVGKLWNGSVATATPVPVKRRE